MTATDLVLGTAGHIDHGKSSLVQALTGVNPDRLAEEKRRGITIELGFARLDLPDGTTLGVVDVPGHERFVRQMIAGATGIDMALLCIAADDGIMPQTREHLAVLQLLGITKLVVALTKIDLAEEEWAGLVSDEIVTFLKNTPYAEAEIVPVSVRTGQGIDRLKEVLAGVAHKVERAKAGRQFRLPVDRVFTIKGAGTVVTGTLWSGEVAVDDKAEILPLGMVAKIRSIQVHGLGVARAVAGHRVAMNLAGVTTDDVCPGDFVAYPGLVQATIRFDGDFTFMDCSGRAEKGLANGARVHIAHGAKEVTGRIFMLKVRDADGGEANDVHDARDDGDARDAGKADDGCPVLVQIRLDEPLPVMWQDRYIVRSYSPVRVIGGGMVLQAHPRHSTIVTAEERRLLKALENRNTSAMVRCGLALCGVPVKARDLSGMLELEEPTVVEELYGLVAKNEAICLRKDGIYVACEVLKTLCSRVENVLLSFHAEQPYALGIVKDSLRERCSAKISADTFDALLSYLAENRSIELNEGKVSHPEAGKGARIAEQQALEKILEILNEAGTNAPTIEECITQSGLSGSLVYRALDILEKQGKIKKLSGEYCAVNGVVASMENIVRNRLAQGPAGTPELRDLMGTNRKMAMVFLEYFDAHGVCHREGDVRVLDEK